jgi:nitrogen regulatory protein P-II 1
VVLEAEAVDEVVDMIEKTLHTGSLSDGKFFILPVEEAVWVLTGERGKQTLY